MSGARNNASFQATWYCSPVLNVQENITMRALAGAAVLVAASACFVVPSSAVTRSPDVSRAISAASDNGTRVAQNCQWVWREKLCQTEWGRRKYPACC